MAHRRALIEATQNRLYGSATSDVASIADKAKALVTVTVNGAKLGDFALGSCSLSLAGLELAASVNADNSVVLCLVNNTGGAVDLASATFKAMVFKDTP